ncbi:hypothetical protein FOZ63_009644, partial [Perkinsus olseni]
MSITVYKPRDIFQWRLAAAANLATTASSDERHMLNDGHIAVDMMIDSCGVKESNGE